MKLKRIVVTSDILRVTGNQASRAGFRANTEFFSALLSPQISAATRLPVEILEWDEADGGFDGQAIYDALGLSADVAGWAKSHATTATPEVVALFAPYFEEALVVGFELTPLLQAVLDALGVPYVDVRWHPLRFLDDIFFGFSSNRASICEAIAAHGLERHEVDFHVGLHRAAEIRRRGFRLEPAFSGTLLIGQTPFDSSLIHEGQISRWDDHADRIAALAATDRLGFRPHPFSPQPTPELSALITRHGIEMLDNSSDIYQLLGSGTLDRVVSLSSGTLIEAAFFGVEAIQLLPVALRYLPQAATGVVSPLPGQGIYAGVYHAFNSVDFWAGILASELDATYPNGRPVPLKPDRLRQVNGSYWGYLGSGGTNVVMPYNTPE